MTRTITFPVVMLISGWLGTASARAQVATENRPVAPPPLASQKADASVTPPAGQALSDRPDDEKAIRSLAEAFARAYNAGDAKALAGFYTNDAESIDEYGDRIQGRDAIQEMYSSFFEERPGATIQIAIESLRFLGPDVAKEEGQTRVTPRGNQPETLRRYTVLYVKQRGQWLHSSVREEQATDVVHHERLKELEWLVGEWLDQGSDSTILIKCRWSEDKNFLIRDFTIHVQGRPVMTVSQRVGWDPLTKQIKSWVFDSEGGYGNALWARNGDQWIIKSTGVLPDGRIATATNLLTRVGQNMARWKSTERTLGTDTVPELAEYVMVRKPPQPEPRITQSKS